MIYCVVSPGLARDNPGAERAFEGVDGLCVRIDERTGDRRRKVARRQRRTLVDGEDRRRVLRQEGRRVSERRAVLIPVGAPELPRRMGRYADQVEFVQRVEPAAEYHEDATGARLAVAAQLAEPGALEQLVALYLDRIWGYLTLHGANGERLLPQVLTAISAGVHRWDLDEMRVRAWVAHVLPEFPGGSGWVSAPAAGQTGNGQSPERSDLEALEWVSDEELLLLIGLLPPCERYVLALRFIVGLGTTEIANVTGLTPDEVRELGETGLRSITSRLAAVTRRTKHGGRHAMRRRTRELRVLQSRRTALLP